MFFFLFLLTTFNSFYIKLKIFFLINTCIFLSKRILRYEIVEIKYAKDIERDIKSILQRQNSNPMILIFIILKKYYLWYSSKKKVYKNSIK